MNYSRLILTISGAVAIMSAASCDYLATVDHLQSQIDTLKYGEIASIKTQIEAINVSISDLKNTDEKLGEHIISLQGELTTLKEESKTIASKIESINSELAILKTDVSANTTKIAELQSTLSELKAKADEIDNKVAALESIIPQLQAKDKELQEKIESLKSYVDTSLADTKDWAEATFATLSQYEALADVVAGISVYVDSLGTALETAKKESIAYCEKAIKEAIEKSESSMKQWVNEKLDDYYTISEVDAKLNLIRNNIADLDESLSKEIADRKADIAQAKADITKAYTAAIGEAINTLEGKIDTKLAENIEAAKKELQSQIDDINEALTSIQNRLAEAEVNIDGLINRIQSIALVPEYSSGDTHIKCSDTDIITFDVMPRSVIASIVEEGTEVFSFNIAVTKPDTKAGEGSAAITVNNAWITESGRLQLAVDTKALEPYFSDGKGISASLVIECGFTSKSSDYFTLVYDPVLPGVFSVSHCTKVQFSKGNLQATYGDDSYSWGFAANQYDYVGDASGNTTIDDQTPGNVVDLFGWSTFSTNHGISTSTKSLFYLGDFIDWGKTIDKEGTWFTLSGGTFGEWKYLLNCREASTLGNVEDARFAKATVNSVGGIMIFPDNYDHPECLEVPAEINNADASYAVNDYDFKSWCELERAGVVFLPAAGYREGSDVMDAGSYGRYWSSSETALGFDAYLIRFEGDDVESVNWRPRYIGHSVRLVTKVQSDSAISLK